MNKIFTISAVLAVVAFAGGFVADKSFLITAQPSINHTLETAATIYRGIALLKASPPLRDDEVALAILDKRIGEITERRIPPGGDAMVRVRWPNSFNSYYEIPGRPELAVIANKFSVPRSQLPELANYELIPDAPQSDHVDMVYVPYSSAIRWLDLIAAGKNYLNEQAARAYRELAGARVISISHPSREVVNVVSPDHVKTLVLVEHVDPAWFSLSDDRGMALAERALILIGANREWAYRYTGSSAGATGLAQFIEPTYDAVVKAYPTAGLIKDYRRGMADHVNAFKAMVLLADLNGYDIASKTDVSATTAMLAAAYNGGPSRVIQAVKRSGSAWSSSSLFPEETQSYVKKYEAISKLGFF